MIFLSFIYDQFLFPKTGANRCRTTGGMDRIDHALRWTIKISLFVLFFTLPDLYEFSMVAAAESSDNNENTATSSSSSSSSSSSWTSPGEDFFHLCSNVKEDDVDKFRNVLEMNPHWIHSRTKAGETCLHLTGIYGNTAITELLLHNGADPNIRTSFEKGLRMHPLSWNIYGGHLQNIILLLENGADINLNFDSMKGDNKIVTSLDVLLELIQNEPNDERFIEIEKVFKQKGAKTMNQIQNEKQANVDSIGDKSEDNNEL